MQRIILAIFCVLTSFVVSAQDTTIDFKELAKKDLSELKKSYQANDSILKVEQDTLVSMSTRLDTNLVAQHLKVVNLRKDLDTLYLKSKTSWDFYLAKEVPKDSLNAYFTLPVDYKTYKEREKDKEPLTAENKDPKPFKPTEEKLVTQNYLFFGDDKVVLKEDFIKDPTVKEIFNNVLKDDRILNLGDFWFPQDGQEILLDQWPRNSESKIEKDSTALAQISDSIYKRLKFYKIEVELYEGSLVDIKVYLKNDAGNVYLFENRNSISLLRYTTTSQRFYLTNRSQQTYEDTNNDFANYRLRLSDVLRYFSSPGKNFVPDNQNFVFPLEIKDTISNKTTSNIYELQQTTALENVLDLRAYTDFLGVFGDAENGIASFEGDATFFVNPFRAGNTPFFLFKRIRPYVSFARLDEENRFLALTDVDDPDLEMPQMELVDKLDNLQQSYLDLGITLDVVSFKVTKEMPFEVNLYTSVRYQIAELQLEENNEDYKTLGAGAGIHFDFRRFDNFSFSYNMEWTRYNQNQYNNLPGIKDTDAFWVFRNEAEVAYFAGGSKRNAIFVRLKNFDDLSSKEGSNFFQFQFGYRFGIGLQKVKGKN